MMLDDVAKKIKLENQFKPKLIRFFRQVSKDVGAVISATGSIPSLRSYGVDLTAILREHYRSIYKNFKGVVLPDDKKSYLFITDKKQDELLDAAIVEFINSHSLEQQLFIIDTTEKELNSIFSNAVIAASLAGAILSNVELSKNITKEFNNRNKNRVDTIAMTETQTVSETIKLLEAENFTDRPSDDGRVKTTKTWNTVLDDRTRYAHVKADRQTVGIDDVFVVGGEYLEVPGDTSSGASLWNVINCRCTAIYNFEGQETLPVDTPNQDLPDELFN